MTRLLFSFLIAALFFARAHAALAADSDFFPEPPPPCPSDGRPCLATGVPISLAITPKIVRVGDTITITASRNDGQALSMNWGVDHLQLAEKAPSPWVQNGVTFALGILAQVGSCPTTATSCSYKVGFVPTPNQAYDTLHYDHRYWLAIRIDNSNEDYFGIYGTIVQGHIIHAGSTDVRSLIRFTMHDDTDTTSSYAISPKQVNNDSANFYQMVLPERTFEMKITNSHEPSCLTTPSKFFFVNGDPVQTIDFVCGAPTLGATIQLSKNPIDQSTDVTATLTVTNPGPGRVTNISAPTNLTLGGDDPGIVEKKSGPVPSGELGLDEGAHQDFIYVYHAKGNGNLTFSATVDGKTSTLATIHSNTATASLKVLNSASLTADTIVEAYEGRKLTYEGKGFDPDGGPITLTFNNVQVKTEAAAATFKGTLPVPAYPPITVKDLVTQKPRCEGRLRATQGDTTAYTDMKAPSGEIVIFADNIFYENGTPLSRKEWSFLCRGAVLYDADGNPMFAHHSFPGGATGILLTNNFNDIQSGRPEAVEPPEGKLTRPYSHYNGMLLQAAFADHSTLNVVGGNPFQMFVGENLVLDTGREQGGPVSVLHAPVDVVLEQLLAGNGLQFAAQTPPPNDLDSDGIEDAIDGDIVLQGNQTFFSPRKTEFSTQFANTTLGGNVGGGILQRDGVTLHFSGSASGIAFAARSVVGDDNRNRRATVRACRSAVRMGDGSAGVMSCGSLILAMTNGEAAIVLGVDSEVIVPAGATVEVTEIDDSHVEVKNLAASSVAATISENGSTSPVAPGATAQRTVIADHDGDGIGDVADACPDDPAKSAPGVCGCGSPDTDSDGDGTLDCIDACAADPGKLTPDGSCGCGCCEPASKPKVALGKILPPTGDDTISVQATFPVFAATFDPITDGFELTIGDSNGTPIAVVLPGGAYAKATKTGWKVNKKHTAWSFTQAKGAPGGVFGAAIKRGKDGAVTVKVTGKGGAFAATPPLVLTTRFPGGLPCGTSAFDVGKQSCVLKSKGKALTCK